MYRLAELAAPDAVPGRARLAEPPDARLVASFAGAFHAEASPESPADDWTLFAEHRIAAGEVHLWVDGSGGAAVSMAVVSAPVAGVARVDPVYTPPAWRRRGYAAAVTAAATRAALDGGARDVVLYADLANPTSNSIYQAIGYSPHHDAENRVFLWPTRSC